MRTLARRLLRLEAVNGRRLCRYLSDEELDAAMAAGFTEWLEADPDACPRDVLAEVLAFIGAQDEEGAARWALSSRHAPPTWAAMTATTSTCGSTSR